MKMRRFSLEIVIHVDAAELDLSLNSREEWAMERAGRIMDDAFISAPARFAFRIERWENGAPMAEGTVYVRVFRPPGEFAYSFEADFKAPLDFSNVAF